MTDGSGPRTARPRWRWFAAWAVVGAMIASLVAAAFASLPLLPLIAIGIALLGRGERAEGALGVMTGLGLPLLLVAYLNRQGPGEHCTVTATSETCEDLFSPLPWLIPGVVLVVAGVILFVRRRRAQVAHA